MQAPMNKYQEKTPKNAEECTEDHTLQHTDSRAHMAVIVISTDPEHPGNIPRINSPDTRRKGTEGGHT